MRQFESINSLTGTWQKDADMQYLNDFLNGGTVKGTFSAAQPDATRVETVEKPAADIVQPPALGRRVQDFSEFMWAVQEWDGRIVSIQTEYFSAILSPVSGDEIDTETLEYPLNLLTPSERLMLHIGTAFRLSCGFTRRRSGTLSQHMALLFRPTNITSRRDARAAAAKLKTLLDDAVEAPVFTRHVSSS